MPIFGAFPSVDTGVTMLIYIMMALGLNIVVGYAGLLDLGYVAFYAMGAYTAAWFASQHFQPGQHPYRRRRRQPGRGRDPHLDLARARHRRRSSRRSSASSSASRRCGCAATTSRSSRSASARSCPRSPGTATTSSATTSRTAPQGINPIDPPGFGNTLHDAVGLPADYLTFNVTFLGHTVSSVELFYWTALGLVLFTVFCSVRLRDSRLGRAWIAIREDETAAAAMGVPLMRTKTWAYAAGAFFGGIAGAYYASFKSGHLPRRLLLQHLRLHPLHGHPRRDGQHLGRDPRRRLPRLPEPGGPGEHRRLAERALRDGQRAVVHVWSRPSTSRCTSSGSSGHPRRS